jgi:hypothetical protein
MLHVDRELHKLMVARGQNERLAFILNSAADCEIVSLYWISGGRCEVGYVGQGATAAEAFESAWKNSADEIAKAGVAFREKRQPAQGRTSSKVPASTVRKTVRLK